MNHITTFLLRTGPRPGARRHCSLRRNALEKIAALLIAIFLSAPGLCAQVATSNDRDILPTTTDQDDPFVPELNYTEASDELTLGDSKLGSDPGTQIGLLSRAGTLGLNYCNDLTIHSGALRVTLDLGEDYNYGTTTFSVIASLRIEGVDTDSGDTTLIIHDPVLLKIDQDKPEQTFYVGYSGTNLGNHDLVDEYRVIINGYRITGPVDADVRLTLRYEDEYAVDAIRPSPDEDEPILYLIGVSDNFFGGNPTLFSWKVPEGCSDEFPSFRLQVMRLYNTDPDYAEDPAKLETVVDWSGAMTIDVTDVPTGYYSYRMTLARGTGWYLWRVRPIGSKYPGGAADSRNWGVWTSAPADGEVLDYDGLLDEDIDTFAFYYRQFEDTLNWVYSRRFTEGEDGRGSRVAEGMTFFTPGGRPAQSQTREAETGAYHTTDSPLDFQGQPTFEAMSAPTGFPWQGFRFRRKFISKENEPYGAKHFDDDANYNDPESVYREEGTLNDYWSGFTLYGGGQVPSAENYPFSRTLLATDGSGRPREISRVGQTYRIGGGAGGRDRTTKIYYASASDQELLRLFGDEAPADSNVYKVMVTDPNKVTSVSWVHGGRTIATALQVAQGDTLLLGLDDSTEARLSGTIIDTLGANRRSGRSSLSASKRYAFADSTEVTITYRFTPDTITASALCVDTCATCDYLLRLYAHPIDSDSISASRGGNLGSLLLEYRLGADPCGQGATIDTTLTLTFPPGTYIVERRLEVGGIDTSTITDETPYGLTHAEQFRGVIAGGIRQKMIEDDSVETVLGYLADNDLEGLYLYLGLDLDLLENYESVTLYTECCEVTFPILSPDCGFDPCRDSVPDFEAYLFEKWGDDYGTDLNTYFKFDGQDDVWPPENKPSGPFDKLVANMLSDTNAGGEYLYSCQDLWYIWVGLVDSWEQMKVDSDDPTNPDAFNPDFDLLASFLQSAGVYWIDTSHTPYNANNGYLLWAHRYLYKNVLSEKCTTETGYNTAWHGDIDSTDKWKEIYGCRRGQQRGNRNSRFEEIGAHCDLSAIFDGRDGRRDWNDSDDFSVEEQQDSCMAYTGYRIEDMCRTRCESRRDEFASGIVRAYKEDGRTICYEDALCMADAIVDSCLGDCDLTIFGSDPIDSIGSTAEKNAIDRVFNGVVEFAVPVDDGSGARECANDTMALYQNRTVPFTENIVDFLNSNIDEWVRLHGGNSFNIKEALRECSPDSLVDLLTDSMIFLPPIRFYKDTAFIRPYFELRDSCELWYVTDTLSWSEVYPGQVHPMVTHLNAFLDGLWGSEIDSSVAGIFTDCELEIDGSHIRIRKHDTTTTHRDEVDIYSDLQVIFVNGSSSYSPIDTYIEFSPFYEYSVLFDHAPYARLMGDVLLQGPGANPDFLNLRTRYRCTSEGLFIDHIHRVAGKDSCRSEDTVRTIYGLRPDTTLFGLPTWTILLVPSPGFEGTGNLDHSLDMLYTNLIGRFEQTEDDSLAYINYFWHPGNPFYSDTCTIFEIAFLVEPTKKLGDNLCTDKPCPDICWRWIDPEVDTGGALAVGPPPCEETATRRIRGAIDQSVQRCIDKALVGLRDEYDQVCGGVENLDEEIRVTYPVDYIHFSLYYYDRAGRLVRTVPPKGVNVLADSVASRSVNPLHTYATEYDYNSLGQLLRSKSPDRGESRFWYDRHGRLRFSQDARLAALSQYAYTKFDKLGRVVETGVSSDSVAGEAFAADSNIDNRLFPGSGTERVYIAYDTTTGVNYLDGSPQRFTRNRVSRSWTDENAETHYSYDVHGNIEWIAQIIPDFPETNYIEYEYDLLSGNVNQVIYNRGRVDEFRHRYSYDADNALTRVETSYNGVIWDSDARYEYYPHGALRRIELGEDKLQGLDLSYTVHGQLKGINERTLTQANDPGRDGTRTYRHAAYAADSFAVVLNYNQNDFSHGKSPLNSGGADDLVGIPLYDGNISGVELNVGKVTGAGKYEELTGTTYRYDQLGRLDSSRFHTFNGGTDSWNAFSQEYLTTYEYDANGNITRLIRHADDPGTGVTAMDSLEYHYKAGQSNRLDYLFDAVAGDPHTEDIENTQSAGNYEYDEIGNLIQDWDEGFMSMNWDAYGKVKSVNYRLPIYPWRIKYTYDASGNRVKKRVLVGQTVNWNESSTTFYTYDAEGRVVAIYKKACGLRDQGGEEDSDFDGVPDGIDNCGTFWVPVFNPDQRDTDGDGQGDACDPDIDGDGLLNGTDPCPYDPKNACPPNDPDSDGVPNLLDNCPGVFNPAQIDTDKDGLGDACDPDIDNDGINNDHDTCPWDKEDDCECDYRLVELPIYGLGRVGVARPDIWISDPPNRGPTYTRELGEKHYELTDHLGNVRAVLGDRKLTGTPGAGNYYADIEAYSHPYPFGMPQPGRRWDNSLWYRYGFNGMESDLGVKGTGNHYTTYFRQYDPRSGRWWSVDPVIHPWESSYASFHNNPVFFTDPFGSNPEGDDPPKGDPPWLPDPRDYDIGETWTHEETGHVYRKEEDGEWWGEGGTTATVDFAKQRGQHSDVAFLTPVLTPIWDMGSGEAPDPPRPMVYVPQLTITNSGTGTSINGWYDGNQPRMSTPPPGWSLQRPFEKETTAAEWFESTDIPLMAVVRGITEIPARSLEVTANYACILATGKRCDGSDPTPEDLESGYYSIMPGGGKGAAKNAVAARGSKPVLNAVNTGKRTGSAAYKSLNVDDAQHFFSNIVDNYASQATKFGLKGGDGVVRDLYQIGGSLRGRSGIFEWIVEGSKVTHRRFIPGGTINGIPNQIIR